MAPEQRLLEKLKKAYFLLNDIKDELKTKKPVNKLAIIIKINKFKKNED